MEGYGRVDFGATSESVFASASAGAGLPPPLDVHQPSGLGLGVAVVGDAKDGFPPRLRIRSRGSVAETGGGQAALRPPGPDVGKVPVHPVRRRVTVQLVPHVDEGLRRRHVDVVDGREVEDDGLESRSLVLVVDLGRPRRRVVPGTTRPRRVGVVETLCEAVNEDARVRATQRHARIRPVLVTKRQEAGAQRKVRLVHHGLLLTVSRLGTTTARHDHGSADAHDAQHATAAEKEAPDENGKGYADGDVDAHLDGGKDGGQHAGGEDDGLERRHAPELHDDGGRRDDVTDGVDDDGRQRGAGDVEEDAGEGVEGQQDDHGGDDAGKGGPHPGLGLDGGARKGAGGGIGAEEGAQHVADADGDQFLRRVDDVVVDAAKGL
ncbi:hypothetical protein L249_4625 [Ophiocordyceps polyrhachis-furcata BCC 54312]|uniref:Uncharacterized protein n=1 Tax=Ophiocordyceps polyrhachis-furcata BCC 54312 TaxID=1330021 RepID=A0A367L2Q0_9HYPO|nr:hypothetical protein L249_4625 [Ophiocordyceps polyrhachis-furcata BCC 54312]